MPRTKCSYEQVVEAAKTHKTKRATALALGIDYETIQSYCRLWPSLERLFLTGREELVSAAESGLWKAVERGEAWAISFTLKTQGKHLGYTERQEIVTSGEPLEIVTEIVRVRRDGGVT